MNQLILLYQWNPFDLTGPLFLVLYVTLLAAAGFLAYMLRAWAVGREGDSHQLLRADQFQDPNFRGFSFDAYEVAYLNGGQKLAIETAIAALVQSNSLHLSFFDNTLSTVAGSPGGSHPLEKTVYRLVASGEVVTVKVIRLKAAAAAGEAATRIKRLGLVISGDGRIIAHIVPVLIMGALLLFGLTKVLIGMWRGRPVGFLLVLCAITAYIGFRLYKAAPLRTTAGDQTLERLKRENAALESTAASKPEGLAPGDVALAMALFGMTALAFTDQSWSVLQRQLFPPAPTSSSSSWGGSSSCSSSSCSSSSCSSCGGGGGCGGCGS